jgi:hypothetical protein
MVITQEVINQIHDMLQWDSDFSEADVFKCMVPRTCAGLMKVCQWLEVKHSKPTELVIIPWSVAEALIDESLDIFMGRDWNFNLGEDQQELERTQLFKIGTQTGFYEAGYVGILADRIPVVASIHCRLDGLATVASAPNQVEVDGKNNTIYIKWSK